MKYFHKIITYDMIFIYCNWFFYPVAAVGKSVQKQEKDNYIQKEKQYPKQHKTTEYTK